MGDYRDTSYYIQEKVAQVDKIYARKKSLVYSLYTLRSNLGNKKYPIKSSLGRHLFHSLTKAQIQTK